MRLEREMKKFSGNIRSVVKAHGLQQRSNVVGQTFAVFRVDRIHHLLSVVSKVKSKSKNNVQKQHPKTMSKSNVQQQCQKTMSKKKRLKTTSKNNVQKQRQKVTSITTSKNNIQKQHP